MDRDPLQAAIRNRAHRIWEAEGRPEGRALDHWLRAEREARAESESRITGLRVPTQTPEPAEG